MIKHVLLLCLMIHCTIADPKAVVPVPVPPVPVSVPPLPKHAWLTLHGDEPYVVANGGFSGLYPPQTELAYSQSIIFGKGGTVLLCDLHMSRDGHGFCLSQLNLQNTTNAADAFPNRKKTYIVNGKELQGWFALDLTSNEMFDKLIGKSQLMHQNRYILRRQIPDFVVFFFSSDTIDIQQNRFI